MVAGVAHDLLLPLSHIKGFVSSLRRTDVEWDERTRSDFLAEIELEADRLAEFVESLLDTAHLVPGQIQPDVAVAEPLSDFRFDLDNDVHQYLAESDAEKRPLWIRALDTVETLHPEAVIAGHKRPGRADDPRIIEETRQYIRDFDRVARTTATARELYDQVLAVYPNRVNPGALWTSARALKG